MQRTFPLSKLQQASADLTGVEKELATLTEQRERCESTANIGTDFSTRIDELRRKKSEADAQAFLSNSKADTSSIDEQISKLENESAAILEAANTARVAIEVLAPRIEEAEAKFLAASEALKAETNAALFQVYAEGLREYHDALEPVKRALAKMCSAAVLQERMKGGSELFNRFIYMFHMLSGESHIRRGLVTFRAKDMEWIVDPELFGYQSFWEKRVMSAVDDIGGALTAQGARI